MDYVQLRAWLEAHGTGDDTADAAALRAATVATTGSTLVTPDEFVDRFAAAEFTAAVDSADANVRKLIFRLRVRQEPLDLASATVHQGLGYMAHIGLLTAERAAAIGAIPAGPMVAPCTLIGCGLMLEMDEPSAALAVAQARTWGDEDGSD